MFCNKCGAQIEDGAKFCPVCGAPVEAQAPQVNPGTAIQEAASPVPDEVYYAADDEMQGFTSLQTRALVRILAIGAYVFLPLIILNAIFMKDKKYIMHHTNNALVLTIFIVGASIIFVIPILGWIVGGVVSVFCTVMMILSIIAAAKGRTYTMKILGKIRILKF